MNTQLEPPTVKPMSPETRSRLRHEILDQVREPAPRHGRRWAPALAAAATVAVVAGGLVATNELRQPDQPGVAAGISDQAIGVDLGAPTQAEVTAAIKWCVAKQPARANGATANGATVVYARYYDSVPKVWPFDRKKALALIFRTRDGAEYGRPGLCLPYSPGEAQVSPEQLTPLQLVLDNDDPRFPMGWTDVRGFVEVGPQVVRVETRLTWPGGKSPWYRSPLVDNGLALAYAKVPREMNVDYQHGARSEVRAFDAKGKLVPLR